MNLGDITNGERLLLERRRHRESQAEAAGRYGVSRYRYRRWESGREDGPRPALRSMRAYEALYLLRRRAGTPLHALAQTAGISRWWLCQIERGQAPAGRLAEFWHQNRPRQGRNGR